MGKEVAKTQPKVSLLAKMAAQSNLEPVNFLNTIKKTVMKGNPTLEQVTAFLMVADRYQLDPVTKQIYAFAEKGGGVVPIVSADGWIAMAERHPQFNGEVVTWSDKWVQPQGGKRCPEWVEFKVQRKDREYPTVHREYLDECYRATGPWQQNTKRMLEHKGRSQSYRIAFGFSGIYDEDEAQRIAVEGMPQHPTDMPSSNAEKARKVLAPTPSPEEPEDAPEAPPEAESEVVEDAVMVDDNGEVIGDEPPAVEEYVEEVEVEDVEEDLDAVEQIKQAFDAVEVTAEEEAKPVLKATKKQLEALVAAKDKGGWTDAEVSSLIKARYGVEKARDLERTQAIDLIRHLLSQAALNTQEGLDL